jgi:hypothetical protein
MKKGCGLGKENIGKNKKIFELDEIREKFFQGIINRKKLDDKFIFYYDESNNFRKLYLTENGINIRLDNIYKNFVLGGICFKKKIDETELVVLKDNLKLQKNIKEIKLKHIAKGNFLECLSSKKLNIFLQWIYANSYLHYSSLNYLFWSIIDIIESSILLDFDSILLHFALKTIFYEIVKANLRDFVILFNKYSYPNIKKEMTNEFLEEIIQLLENCYKNFNIKKLRIEKDIFNFLFKHLIFVLKNSKNKELTFIMNEKNSILIENLKEFYLRPLYTFVNSKHIFDEERSIEKFFEDYEEFVYKKNKIDICFVNSKYNEFIQLSDVMIGLIGKMYEYLNMKSMDDIEKDINDLNNIQRKNLILLKNIIIKSDKVCKCFIHSIEPLTEKRKFELVLNKV